MRVVLLNERRAERDAMLRALQDASCSVEPLSDPKATLDAVSREAPQIIVVSVPPTGGPELVSRIRGADPSGQAYLVVVLERTSSGHEVSTLLAAGAHDFLRRPVSDFELVERVKAPARLLRWARSIVKPTAFLEEGRVVNVGRLAVWKNMGSIVAGELGQLVGEPLQASPGWPKRFSGRDLRGATIPMSLASEQVELRISILVDEATLAWLGGALLGDQNAGDAAMNDVLRELANTAAGAVKRAALPENVTLTTGIPFSDHTSRESGEGIRCWCVTCARTNAELAIVGEIRGRENQRIPASSLREGMVLAHDLRSESGALLVTAGSRLTSTTATRLAQMLGPRFVIEVAYAA